MYILFRNNAPVYMKELVNYDIKMGSVDKYDQSKYYKWDDATIIVGYLDYVMRRLRKYSLDRGVMSSLKFPYYKEKLQKEEDQLVDYFLYEMRKSPLKREEIPKMHQS